MKAFRDAAGHVVAYIVPCPECSTNTRFYPGRIVERRILDGKESYLCMLPKCRARLRIRFGQAQRETLPAFDKPSPKKPKATYRIVETRMMIDTAYMHPQ